MSMDLVWFDGFDLYADGTDLSNATGSVTNISTVAIERTVVRNSGTGAGSLGVAANAGALTVTVVEVSGTASNFVVGFNLYLVDAARNRSFMRLYDPSECFAIVETGGTGNVQVWDGAGFGGDPLLSGSTALAADTWYYIEIQYQISAENTADSCRIIINGTVDATNGTSNLQTSWWRYNDASVTSTYLQSIRVYNTNIPFYGMATPALYFDDMYLLVDPTGSFTGPLGPVRVDFMVPTTDVIAEFAIAGTSPGGPNPHSSVVGCYVPAWGGPYLQCGSGALDEGAKDEYSGWMFPGGFAPSGYNIFAFAPTIAYSAWSGGDESATLLCGLSEVYDANSADSFVYSGGSLYGCLAITVPTTQVNAIASLVCTSLSGSSDSLYMDWLNSVTQYVNVR